MTRSLVIALAGGLALAAASLASAPAAALPVAAPLVALGPDGGALSDQAEAIRWHPLLRRGRHRLLRRGRHRPFVRRGLAGHPIRRILRRL